MSKSNKGDEELPKPSPNNAEVLKELKRQMQEDAETRRQENAKKPREYVAVTRDHQPPARPSEELKEQLRKTYSKTNADGSVQPLNVKEKEDLQLLANKIGAIAPIPLSEVKDVRHATFAIPAESGFIKDYETEQKLALMFINDLVIDANKRTDLSVENNDFLAYLPLVNIPVLACPLYVQLSPKGSTNVFIDSFQAINFYKKTITYLCLSADFAKTRRLELLEYISLALNADKFDVFKSILDDFVIFDEDYTKLKKDVIKLKKKSDKAHSKLKAKTNDPEKRSNSDIARQEFDKDIERAHKFFREKIFCHIKDIKKIDMFSGNKDLSDPKYSEDVHDLRAHLLGELWNKEFWEQWDILQKEEIINVKSYIRFFYERTTEILYFFELCICKLLVIAGAMKNEDINAVCSNRIVIPAITDLNDSIILNLSKNRVAMYEFRSKVTKSFTFKSENYQITDGYISEEDISIMQDFCEFSIGNDKELDEMLQARENLSRLSLKQEEEPKKMEVTEEKQKDSSEPMVPIMSEEKN
jgi:hypothetical protein